MNDFWLLSYFSCSIFSHYGIIYQMSWNVKMKNTFMILLPNST